jgi:hypothetical protein
MGNRHSSEIKQHQTHQRLAQIGVEPLLKTRVRHILRTILPWPVTRVYLILPQLRWQSTALPPILWHHMVQHQLCQISISTSEKEETRSTLHLWPLQVKNFVQSFILPIACKDSPDEQLTALDSWKLTVLRFVNKVLFFTNKNTDYDFKLCSFTQESKCTAWH